MQIEFACPANPATLGMWHRCWPLCDHCTKGLVLFFVLRHDSRRHHFLFHPQTQSYPVPRSRRRRSSRSVPRGAETGLAIRRTPPGALWSRWWLSVRCGDRRSPVGAVRRPQRAVDQGGLINRLLILHTAPSCQAPRPMEVADAPPDTRPTGCLTSRLTVCGLKEGFDQQSPFIF